MGEPTPNTSRQILYQYSMKRYLHYAICVILGTVLIGCQKEETTPELTDDGIVSQFYSNNILITVSKGANLETKSSSECQYYTITGELNDKQYSMFLEVDSQDDGLSINRTFSEDGILLFTEAILDGELVSVDFSDLEQIYENWTGNGIIAESMGARKRGERYRDCVKRVHKELKEAFYEANEFWCDIFDLVVGCGAIAAISAVIDCAEYQQN